MYILPVESLEDSCLSFELHWRNGAKGGEETLCLFSFSRKRLREE